MTDASTAPTAAVTQAASVTLGAPGAPLAEACSQAAISALREAAGEGFRMTSLALDIATHPMGEGQVEIVARTDKRATSIVFVSVTAHADGRMVFSAQGLFSRMQASSAA